MKISCVIPAYNEEEQIAKTLEVLLQVPELFEIIVVDDSSVDSTKEIVKKFPTVILIEHVANEGKSKTVADGIKETTGDYIFLLDADLCFLNKDNIVNLIKPIMDSKSEVTISYRKNAWPLFPFKEIDYLSGERILPKAILSSSIEEMSKLPGYGLEVFINRIIIRNHLSISVVQWPNVENVFNQHKYGWWKGVRVIMKIWMNVLSTVSIVEMYSQNFRMRKLLVR